MVKPAARRHVVQDWVQRGLLKNRKRTYRIYTEEKLQVHTKRRKKLVRPRIPMVVPTRCNERWSIDFVSDRLSDGRRFRVLNVVDDFSRECVGQLTDTSISGARLARFLSELDRPLAKTIVCDNGPELTCKAMFFWSMDNNVKLHFIQPGNRRRTHSWNRLTASSAKAVLTNTGSDP